MRVWYKGSRYDLSWSLWGPGVRLLRIPRSPESTEPRGDSMSSALGPLTNSSVLWRNRMIQIRKNRVVGLTDEGISWFRDQNSSLLRVFFLRTKALCSLIIRMFIGTSLVVQWFGTSAVPVRGPGSLPGRGATIPQCAAWPKKKI